MLPMLEDCRARTQYAPLAGAEIVDGRRAGSWCHGWILGYHHGLHRAMLTVPWHDVNYLTPDALTGG